MRIALVQSQVSADKTENLETALKSINKAAKKGAQIVCLPELFTSQYFCTKKDPALFALAEPIPGPASEKLALAAEQNKVVLIGGSLFENAAGHYYNTAVVFNQQGEIIHKYRKTHIPNDHSYWEKFYFLGGDLSNLVVDTDFGKVGVLICYDQWFPEAARIAALQGAQIIFYPTAIGWTKAMKAEEKNALQNWIDVQRSHAVVNHLFVAAVNRVGSEEEIAFWGSSFVADPFGELIKKGSEKTKQILFADCDFSKIEKAKQWMFLDNRRPETYGALQR